MVSVELVRDEEGRVKGLKIQAEKEDLVGLYLAEDFPLGERMEFRCVTRSQEKGKILLNFDLDPYLPNLVQGSWVVNLDEEIRTEDLLSGMRRRIEALKRARAKV